MMGLRISADLIGIDPGTSNPGLAWIRGNALGFELVELPVLHSLEELIKTLGEWADSMNNSTARRMRMVAVESVAWGLHSGESGHGSGRILEAVGAARMFAEFVNARLVTIAPSTWRKAVTGSGKATKEQVRDVLARRVKGWPKGTVGLNRSDAVAIAVTGGMRA